MLDGGIKWQGSGDFGVGGPLRGAGLCHRHCVIFFLFPLKSFLIRLETGHAPLDHGAFHVESVFLGGGCYGCDNCFGSVSGHSLDKGQCFFDQ
jgi:hypothetical protein